jgi:hypothetical protein
MAKLITNLIYILFIMGVYIKALYNVINVSKLTLDLAGDYSSNTL